MSINVHVVRVPERVLYRKSKPGFPTAFGRQGLTDVPQRLWLIRIKHDVWLENSRIAIVEVCLNEVRRLSANLWPDVLEALVEWSISVAVIQVCERRISYKNRLVRFIFNLYSYSECPKGFLLRETNLRLSVPS